MAQEKGVTIPTSDQVIKEGRNQAPLQVSRRANHPEIHQRMKGDPHQHQEALLLTKIVNPHLEKKSQKRREKKLLIFQMTKLKSLIS